MLQFLLLLLELLCTSGQGKESQCLWPPDSALPEPSGFYPLTSATAANDSSLYENPPGVVKNAYPGLGVCGENGGSYSFTGSRSHPSYIKLSKSEFLDTRYSITIVAWVYPEGNDGEIVSYWQKSNYGLGIFLDNLHPTFHLYSRDKTIKNIFTSKTRLQLNTWNHVTGSHDRFSGNSTIYVNGTPEFFSGSRLELQTEYDLWLGSLFKGRLTHIVIFNTSLSKDQINESLVKQNSSSSPTLATTAFTKAAGKDKTPSSKRTYHTSTESPTTIPASSTRTASRQFTGEGYMEYRTTSGNIINSDKDELHIEFSTVQTSGLLFYARNSGGQFADYVALELVGGRLRFSIRYGRSSHSTENLHETLLGKNLNDAKSHSVEILHDKDVTTIYLDKRSDQKKAEYSFKTKYTKLDIDVAMYVGGAADFKDLLSVKSNALFMGCIFQAEFKKILPGPEKVIDFLKDDKVATYPSTMNKKCEKQTYEPFTFSSDDSSFVCSVGGLSSANSLSGRFMFRTYKTNGVLLKQVNGGNGFELSYMEKDVQLKVIIRNSETLLNINYRNELTKINKGNWHYVTFNISQASFELSVGSKRETRTPAPTFPSNFFKGDVTAGGFVGCMNELTINKQKCQPNAGSRIKNVEWSCCNITDFCIFSPCLHGGECTQTGKTFSCGCSGTGYDKGSNSLSVCQFSESESTCDSLKKNNPSLSLSDRRYPLDFDDSGPIKTYWAFCNFSADPPTTRVESRDFKIKLTPSNQSISQRISYEPSLHAAKALARRSEWCYQYVDFGCKKAMLHTGSNNEKLGFWVSSTGVYQSYWGGAKQGSRSCACGETNPNSCIDSTKKCNCDAGLDKWHSDEGFLNSTTLLPVVEVMFKGVTIGTEANFTVGHLYCAGEISNTATFVNEDGFIKLKKWSPPSNGVISLFFKTPYKKGVLLYNGMLDKDFFRVEIINETSVGLSYNIGNGVRKIELSLGENQVNDRSWHHVVIYHNMKVFGFRLDNQEGKHENPLFLKRELNLDNELYVAGYPYDVSKGFVGCIRGLDINGEVQDLSKLAGEAEFMKSGCGAACENNSCKNHAKCLDNYNVYLCDCSKTPYYGYFCHKENGASFNDPGSQLVYEYPCASSVFRFDIVVGFKLGEGKPCSGDIIRLDSSDKSQFYRLSLTNRKLQFDFKGPRGQGSITIDPPSVGDFCRDVHTFALSRRYKVVNYTIDGVQKPKEEIERLDGLFTSMKKVTIGKEGDGGFKGCITGVKVTREAVGQKPETVEPIKEYLYDGNKTDGVKDVSRATCGPQPKVPEIPTPRPVGQETDVSTPQGSTTYPKTKTVTISPSSSSASQLSVIVIIYIISILFTVTTSCFQYTG
ncbi:PREDICTED: EGF and laminin G domain-containing protein-like isoform X3 [Acropora digitifera]|uniref:EGF and laminin G domain-containing protein-like isoform X3 n=1 Tax=Acropora digitifera TaxID=70779 RepID=UPI00077A91B6|nr:PREDICTED: EGF and laminin G domain-containing protein-like isoform X3 [Acropora digitifera]